MKTLIISGKSGSGKDAITQKLLERLNDKRILVIHYGDLVKFYCKEFYNWNGQKDEIGRSLLQHLGTDTVRAKYPDYWAAAVAQFADAVRNDFDYCFIPDARFPNEVEVTKKYLLDAKSIRINRFLPDGTPWKNPILTEEQHQHPSETSLDDWKWFDYKMDYCDLDGLADYIMTYILED